jgi:hypothetical protein
MIDQRKAITTAFPNSLHFTPFGFSQEERDM